MKLLINPFEIYSEKALLRFGVVFGVITIFVSSITGLLLFGSLKVINYTQVWPVASINLGITLLSNTLLLYIFGKIRYAKTRFVDVVNVVLIAHVVVYIILYLSALPIIQGAISSVELAISQNNLTANEISKKDMFVLGFFGMVSLCFLIYFFYLLVVGMKIAINGKSKLNDVIVILIVLFWNLILQYLNPYL